MQFFRQISVLPLELHMLWAPLTWKLGIAGCKLMSMITEMVAYVSILTVCAFTFERFTAICYPLRPSLHSGLRRTQIIVCCIWLISLVPSGIWTYYLQVIPLRTILFIVRSQAKVDVFWTIFANFWEKSITISFHCYSSIALNSKAQEKTLTLRNFVTLPMKQSISGLESFPSSPLSCYTLFHWLRFLSSTLSKYISRGNYCTILSWYHF